MSQQVISPQKEKELKERMRRLGVSESDWQESFLRSSGKGGQNVNKVATCVYLYHAPTKLSVKCQEERHQGANRYLARCLLLDKIEQLKLSKERAVIDRQEKQRRQRRKRSLSGKEAVLENKRRHKQRKEGRRKINFYRVEE